MPNNLDQGITHAELAGFIQVSDKVATNLEKIASTMAGIALNQNTILENLRNGLKKDIVDAIIVDHANVAKDIVVGLEAYRSLVEKDLSTYREKLDVKLLTINDIIEEVVEIVRITKNDLSSIKTDIKEIVENSRITKNVVVYSLVIIGVATIVIQLLAKFIIH